MAVPPNLVQLAFANGFDESQEDEILDPTKAFLALVNGRQGLRGGYDKRLGFEALDKSRISAWGTTATIADRTTGNRIGAYRDTVFTIDGTELDLFDQAEPMTYSQGRVPEAGVSARAMPSAQTPMTSQAAYPILDIVEHNGIVGVATTVQLANGTYTIRVGFETVDGVVLRQAEYIGHTPSTVFPLLQLGVVDDYIIALHGSADSATINLSRIDASSASAVATGGWGLVGSVATDHITSGAAFMVQFNAHTLEDRIAFVYINDSGGASRLTVKTVDETGVLETATVNTSSVSPQMIGVEGSNADTLWITWSESTSVKLRGLTGNSLATVKAATGTILTLVDSTPQLLGSVYVVSGTSAGTGRLIANDGNDVAVQTRAFTTSGSTATASGSQITLYDARLRQRPFRLGGRFYGLFESAAFEDGGILGEAVLCDWTDVATNNLQYLRPVANLFPGLVRALGGTQVHPLVSGSEARVAVDVSRSAAGSSATLVTLDYTDVGRWRHAEHNDAVAIGGGVLSYIDGRRVPEIAYLHSPPQPVLASGVGALTGTFSYVATYEQIDGNGDWCVSGVSPPESFSPTADGVVVTVQPLTITNRVQAKQDDTLRVTIYRTTDGGAPPYYYLADYPNDTSTPVSFTDTLDDTDLIERRLLYGTGNLPGTNGSAQDRRAPPHAEHVASYNGMLVIATGSDLWWSGQPVVGEGVWFSPAFQLRLDRPVTALVAADGTLYAFADRTIYAISGEAPADNGSSGGLGTPRRLGVDVGSIDGHTLVTELGIWFRSERGIELLGRGGGVTWVGEGVVRTLEEFPYVTSMALDERNNVVRISLADGISEGRVSSDATGRTVVYDLTLKTWISKDDVTGAFAHEAATSAAIVEVDGARRYAWLSSDGTVYVERDASDADAYLDGTTWIAKLAKTAQFKQGGIQGNQDFNHALILERTYTDHNLSVAVAYNHSQTFETAQVYTRATISGLLTAGFPITQLKHEAHDSAPCEAVQLQLEDVTPTGGTVGSGRGGTWLALTLNITPKPGTFGLPEEAT